VQSDDVNHGVSLSQCSFYLECVSPHQISGILARGCLSLSYPSRAPEPAEFQPPQDDSTCPAERIPANLYRSVLVSISSLSIFPVRSNPRGCGCLRMIYEHSLGVDLRKSVLGWFQLGVSGAGAGAENYPSTSAANSSDSSQVSYISLYFFVARRGKPSTATGRIL